MRRIVTATLFGLLAGALCASFTFRAGIMKFTAVSLVWVLLNRAVMGFTIGASALKLHWAWNGVLMGVVVGSIYSWFLLMSLGAVVFPFLSPIGNAIFGLMIEFFTTVVFKRPAFPRVRPMQRAMAA